MKIRTKELPIEKALAIKPPAHNRPGKPFLPLGGLIRLLSLPDLWATRFTLT